MGTLSPPPGTQTKKTGIDWTVGVVVVLFVLLLVVALRGYLRAQKKPTAQVVQLTAPVVQPTAVPAPTPVPTVDKLPSVAEGVLTAQLKAPSTYRRISVEEIWSGPTPSGKKGHIFKIEYDAQNAYGALLRGCSLVPFQENGEKVQYNPNMELLTCEARNIFATAFGGAAAGDAEMVRLLINEGLRGTTTP
jgi:hypothetical protein